MRGLLLTLVDFKSLKLEKSVMALKLIEGGFYPKDKFLTITRLPDVSRKLVTIITFEEANTDTIGYVYREYF